MKDRQRVLVVGSDGLIGQALLRHFSDRHRDVCGTTRRADRVSIDTMLLDLDQDLTAWRPPPDCSVAYLCAAVTNQEKCRLNPGATRQLNVTKTVELARILVDAGIFVVFLSTNLVFDGQAPMSQPGAAPNPRTEYGRQKVLAEQSLLEMGEKVAVVRLSKVFHGNMTLLKKWAAALRQAETISPLGDLVCSPIPLDFVVNVLDRVGGKGTPGVFQVSGECDVAYSEIALRLARRLEADERLVQPASSQQLGLHLEQSPAHTTMDVSRLVQQLGLTPPTVQVALDSAFANVLRA